MKFKQKIEECKIKFNNKFKYDEKNIIKVTEVMKIKCPIHGDFEQILRVHLRSTHGCPDCANIASSVKQRGTTEDFIRKAKGVHGNLYSYNKTVYVKDKTKVTITCKKHGDFNQDPSSHVSGQNPTGCPHCGVIKIKEKQKHSVEILKELLKDLPDTISVDLSTYTTYTTKMKCTCNVHGEFYQTLPILLNGKYMCPACSKEHKGWNKSLYVGVPTTFYCIELPNNLFKIGITKSNDVYIRYSKEERKSIKSIKYQVTFMDGGTAWEFEKQILRNLREFKYLGSPILKFTGISEILTIDPTKIILKEIHELHNRT